MIVKTESGNLPQFMGSKYVVCHMASGRVYEKVYSVGTPDQRDTYTRKMDVNNGSTAGWFRNRVLECMR